MATGYKIHPAVGVARVGNHESAFLVGPETFRWYGVEVGGPATAVRWRWLDPARNSEAPNSRP